MNFRQKQYEIENSKANKEAEKSEFVNLEKQSKETVSNSGKRVTSKSHSESDLEKKSENKLDVESDRAKPSVPSQDQSECESRVKASFELKENSRVRIASVVENLETKECLPLNNDKLKSDEEQIGRKPVVQIIPAARSTNANRLSVNKRDESNESVGSNAAESQPVVSNAVPVIQANPVNIRTFSRTACRFS